MTRARNAILIGAIASVAVAVPVAAAAGSTSHASIFGTKTVGCGIAIASVTPGQLLCNAWGIPKPKGQNDGDPYVTLAKTGKPQLVLVSQDSFRNVKPASLKSGDTWSKNGFTCTVGSPTVTCKNASGHGFTIGNRHYKAF